MRIVVPVLKSFVDTARTTARRGWSAVARRETGRARGREGRKLDTRHCDARDVARAAIRGVETKAISPDARWRWQELDSTDLILT